MYQSNENQISILYSITVIFRTIGRIVSIWLRLILSVQQFEKKPADFQTKTSRSSPVVGRKHKFPLTFQNTFEVNSGE